MTGKPEMDDLESFVDDVRKLNDVQPKRPIYVSPAFEQIVFKPRGVPIRCRFSPLVRMLFPGLFVEMDDQ